MKIVFFKVTIPIRTPIQDSLNAVDEFNIKEKAIAILYETQDRFFKEIQNIYNFYSEKLIQEFANYNPKKPQYNDEFDAALLPQENHLCWIYNRLIVVHRENPNVDYMLKLRDIILKENKKQFTLEDIRKIYVNGILDNQNLSVTPENCQITFDMHLINVEKKQ